MLCMLNSVKEKARSKVQVAKSSLIVLNDNSTGLGNISEYIGYVSNTIRMKLKSSPFYS